MEKKLILKPNTDVKNMVIAPGCQAGKLLFVSGSAGAKDGSLGIGIEAQARQAMENLGEVLEAAGTSWDKVVKVGCFLVQASRDFGAGTMCSKSISPRTPQPAPRSAHPSRWRERSSRSN